MPIINQTNENEYIDVHENFNVDVEESVHVDPLSQFPIVCTPEKSSRHSYLRIEETKEGLDKDIKLINPLWYNPFNTETKKMHSPLRGQENDTEMDL